MLFSNTILNSFFQRQGPNGPPGGPGDQNTKQIEKLGVRTPCVMNTLCQESLLRSVLPYMQFSGGR